MGTNYDDIIVVIETDEMLKSTTNLIKKFHFNRTEIQDKLPSFLY